ncbi:hypothetical protein BGZ60DRAFT_534277 [Tricladium varicosporioides]|nr:hypothetical protein BGZ60DRAFT_534277 [Hymenoscyphus varicosporioides]
MIDVELKDEEQLLWTSPNVTDTQTAFVSLLIRPYPNQRIIDMEKFTEGIVVATCSETMAFQFKRREHFTQAEQAWNWVNRGDQRAFIMAGDL